MQMLAYANIDIGANKPNQIKAWDIVLKYTYTDSISWGNKDYFIACHHKPNPVGVNTVGQFDFGRSATEKREQSRWVLVPTRRDPVRMYVECS